MSRRVQRAWWVLLVGLSLLLAGSGGASPVLDSRSQALLQDYGTFPESCEAGVSWIRFHPDTGVPMQCVGGTEGGVPEAIGTGSGEGAPTDASYLTRASEAGLSNETSLGSLSTGLLLNTVSAGVGTPSAYAGTSCTNQFPRSLDASGAATCATIQTGDLANELITNAKLANMATATLKGRTTAGTGAPEDLTAAQATAILNVFTDSLNGLAPASGGGTTNFLRADGTWAAPPGGNGGSGTLQDAFDATETGHRTIGPVTTTERICLQGATLQSCFYELAGVMTAGEVTEIASGDRADTIHDLDAGMTHTVRGVGEDIYTLTADTRTMAFAAGSTVTVPGWSASMVLMADALYMQGCTLVTDAALVTGGLVEPFITCGDNDAHGFHRSIEMPDSWDGEAITVLLSVVNVATTPADVYEVHFSAACLRPTGVDVIGTTIATTGEQPVTINFSAGGACGGSACTQNARVAVLTSQPITPNGTCTGTGRLLRIQGQKNSGDSMTSQVAEVKIIGLKVEFTRLVLKDN